MSSDSNLKSWVSDKLMTLLGYSQPTVVQYVIGLSKKAGSGGEVVGKLVELGFSSSGETRDFAEELYSKVPRNKAGVNLYQKQEREAAMLVRKQMTYQLLDADDEDDVIPAEETKVSVVSESKETESHKKRFRRKRDDQDEDEDDEVVPSRIEDRQVKRKISASSDDDDYDSESDEERLRDQREREELERHMKEKDAARTKKLTEPKLSKKEIDEAIRRSNAQEQDDTKELRKFSRQEYLKKREDKKLEELRDEVEDEKYLFKDVEVTEAERREYRYKKEILDLVSKQRAENASEINEYRMPDAYDDQGRVNQEKRFSVAMQRYRDGGESGGKMNPFAEQEAWEQHQIGKATLQFGSKDKKQSAANNDYVSEDQIDFVGQSVMEGDNFEGKMSIESLQESQAKSALEKLQCRRKT